MQKSLIKSNLKLIALFSFLVLFPMVAFAETTITTVLADIAGIIKAVIPIFLSLAIIYFIWGVTKYVISDSEEAKKKGKDVMIYGIIGLTVIFGLWGIINLLTGIIGGQGTAPTLNSTAGNCDATPPPSGSMFSAYLDYIACVINKSVIPLIFALATAMFIWGLVKFLFINAGEEAKREQGRQFMIWGVIALAVMLSVWGLVGVLRSSFGFGAGSLLPKVTPS
jgi:hypothetical protein